METNPEQSIQKRENRLQRMLLHRRWWMREMLSKDQDQITWTIMDLPQIRLEGTILPETMMEFSILESRFPPMARSLKEAE